MAARSEMNSLIGVGSTFHGKFKVNGMLKINGRFEGDIETDGDVIIGEGGKVRTDLAANTVEIAGTIIGNVTASGAVTIYPTGKVLGNIIAPKVVPQEGAVLQGAITIKGSQNDINVKRAIEEEFSDGEFVSPPEETVAESTGGTAKKKTRRKRKRT